MKKTETSSQTIIDLEFKPYIAIFRNNDRFEVVIKGFSNSNINEAIEQAQGALFDYLYSIYDELGIPDLAEAQFETYILCEIKIA